MPRIVLLVGIVLVLYGAAVVAGDRVAGSSPMRSHSRTYGFVTIVLGAVLLLVGVGWLLSS